MCSGNIRIVLSDNETTTREPHDVTPISWTALRKTQQLKHSMGYVHDFSFLWNRTFNGVWFSCYTICKTVYRFPPTMGTGTPNPRCITFLFPAAAKNCRLWGTQTTTDIQAEGKSKTCESLECLDFFFPTLEMLARRIALTSRTFKLGLCLSIWNIRIRRYVPDL